MKDDKDALVSPLEQNKQFNFYKEIQNIIFNYKIELLIIYSILTIILLFKIIESPQKIIESRLISFIIVMYIKEKFYMTTLIGFAGAFTLLIGHLSSENKEDITEKEGKLVSGIYFLHNNLLKISTLALLVVFTIKYYNNTPWYEFYVFIGLWVVFSIIWIHWAVNTYSSYNWKTLENDESGINFNKILSTFAFNLVFIFYIFTLPYIKTLTFNFLNMWMLFMSLLVFASLKYPRTKRVIIQYLDNKEEYAHIVRIENGFARLITKNCASKQVNLSEIKRINYDNDYIEDFRQNWKRTHPWNK